METQPQHNLPAPLVEVLREKAEVPALPRLIESIGCIAADPPEGALISCPVLEACTGLGRHIIMPALRGLESAGIIAQFTPDTSKKPLGGKWILSKTLCFELTDLGKDLVPQIPVEGCKLRNPFLRPTPKQKAVIDCARCLMGRVDPNGLVPPGAFIKTQVAECQGLPIKTVDSIVDSVLQRHGLVSSTLCVRKTWGRGQPPKAYSPTEKGEPWLTPVAAVHCPRNSAEKSFGSKVELSTAQQMVVEALDEIKLAMASGQGPKAISQKAIRDHTGLSQGTVNGVFQKLIKLGYLAKCMTPGSTKAAHYELTAQGLQLLLTHTGRRDALLALEVIMKSKEVLAVFERNRSVLIMAAQDVLARAGVNTFWAEDIVNDAAFRAYNRYIVEGTPVEAGSHLINVFRSMVRGRAVDFVRKEHGTKNRAKRKKTVPLFYDEDTEDKLLARELRLEKAMRRAHPEVLVEDIVLQNIDPRPTSESPEFRDRLVTFLAQMLSVMKVDERNAVFSRYAANTGDIHLTNQEWSKIKPLLHRGGRKAFDKVIQRLIKGQADAPSSEKKSKRTQKTEVLKSIILHQLENGIPGPVPSQDFDAMKIFIYQALYPTLKIEE